MLFLCIDSESEDSDESGSESDSDSRGSSSDANEGGVEKSEVCITISFIFSRLLYLFGISELQMAFSMSLATFYVCYYES